MTVIAGTISWDDVLPELQAGALSDTSRTALAGLAREQLVALAADLDPRRRRTLLALVAQYGSGITVDTVGVTTYPGAIAAFLRGNTEGQRTSGVGTRVLAALHALVTGTSYRGARLRAAVRNEDVTATAGIRVRVLNGALVDVPAVALHAAVASREQRAVGLHVAAQRYARQANNNQAVHAAIAQRSTAGAFIRVCVTLRLTPAAELHCSIVPEYPAGLPLTDESAVNLTDESSSALQTG
ncbi:MAG: hypothetical protein IPH13_20600 [Planctomycetes bacterium]|nr:hypothetical protein [Planctomycetota bacterium]